MDSVKVIKLVPEGRKPERKHSPGRELLLNTVAVSIFAVGLCAGIGKAFLK